MRRFRSASEFVGDAIYDTNRPVPKAFTIVDPVDPMRRKRFSADVPGEDLLVPIFRRGELVYTAPAPTDARERARQQLAMFHPGIKRLANPHRYPAGLELGLHELKTNLVLKARKEAQAGETGRA